MFLFKLQVRSESYQLAKNGARSRVRTSIVGMNVIATSDVFAYHQYELDRLFSLSDMLWNIQIRVES